MSGLLHEVGDRGDERLSICPVCGMTDPGNLDAEHMGWPAHGACVEWLGNAATPCACDVPAALKAARATLAQTAYSQVLNSSDAAEREAAHQMLMALQDTRQVEAQRCACY